MDDEAAFLKALADAPDDDAGRGAYADWLDERGRPDDAYQQRVAVAAKPVLSDPDADDPRLEFADWAERQGRVEHAKLIRLQIELSRKPPCPDWCDHDPKKCRVTWLENERNWLMGVAGRDVWAGPVPLYVTHWNARGVAGALVQRGFIEHMEVPGPVWVEHADWLAARHPVRRVHLTTDPVADVISMVGNGGICCFRKPDGTATEPIGVPGTFDGVRASMTRVLCQTYWPNIRITLR